MAENLTLGLLGGLRVESGGLIYDYDSVGSGPVSLNFRNPRKYKQYMDKTSLTPFRTGTGPRTGYAYGDEVGEANDTQIAEFVDGFPDGMPVLYLRARQGAPVTGSPSEVVGRDFAAGRQYDLTQVIGYTKANIGAGKDSGAQADYKDGPPWPQHGLQTADASKTVNPGPQRAPGDGNSYAYPYDLNAFMRHPTVPTAAKQQDAYMLISAGADRIYGTKDDIQFPAVK